jgi:hypothetical protein
MVRIVLISILFGLFVYAGGNGDNSACKTCHRTIYAEYLRSVHAHASIDTDRIHRAVWERHPDRANGKYTCAKCHAPAEEKLRNKSGLSDPNTSEQGESISCQSCHRIERIEDHLRSNTNVLTPKQKYFYSADPRKKGTKVIFKERSRLWGLIKTTEGSPYHDIDYSNENYYNGKMCMGCHAHKQNKQGFTICDLGVISSETNTSCIRCHMPQVKGPLANQKQTATHAFHGASIHGNSAEHLSRYVHLDLQSNSTGFSIRLYNEATHTLFPHPLRLAQLRVTLLRDGVKRPLPTVSFERVIGTQGKPSEPWLADTVLKDTTIKARERRTFPYDVVLKKGDEVIVELGYYLVNPRWGDEHNLTGTSATEFKLLTRKVFGI